MTSNQNQTEQVLQPQTGNIQQDPVALIGEGALSIAQVNQLQSQIDSKASLAQLTSGLAQKEPTIAEGSLAQSKVANLTTDLAGKASAGELATVTANLTNAIVTSQTTLDRH